MFGSCIPKTSHKEKKPLDVSGRALVNSEKRRWSSAPVRRYMLDMANGDFMGL